MKRISIAVMIPSLIATGSCDQSASEGASNSAAREVASAAEVTAATDRAGEPVAIRFTDVSNTAGIDFISVCGESPSTQILEVNGGGLALLDFDDDGDLDLFISNGATLKDPENGPGCRLYENITNEADGTISFRDVTAASGIDITRWAFGATVGDYDGDGRDDIYVSCFGPNVLLRNAGNGKFQDVSASAGVADASWSASAAWGDIDNDGDLDLYVANYLEFDPPNPPPRATYKGADVLNGPHGLTPQADRLYLNLGDGMFRDITNESGCGIPNARPSFGLNAIIIDMDRDGWQDIVVANDSMPDFLFRNKKGDRSQVSGVGEAINGSRRADAQDSIPQFEEIGVLSGISANADGVNQASMGMTMADVDANGLVDKFTTVFSSDTNALHLNYHGAIFEDRSQQFGLGMISRPYLGWATAFYDFDHDGDEDLIALNGHVYPNATMELMDSEYHQPPLLFARDGKRFRRVQPEESGAWLAAEHRDRAATWGDLDNDGDIDMVVGELNGPIRVLRNDAVDTQKPDASPNWLIVSLRDDRPESKNRRGIGSVIELEAGENKQTRWLYSGGSFQASSAPYVHFAVPDKVTASLALTTTWPDGTKQTINDVTTGRHMTVNHP